MTKKKEMSFHYAKTKEMNSKDASIQCRLPDDSDGENNNDLADMESEEDDGSGLDPDSDEEHQLDKSTVNDKECHRIRCASNDSLNIADENSRWKLTKSLDWSTIEEWKEVDQVEKVMILSEDQQYNQKVVEAKQNNLCVVEN